jgi:L-alanine-DL-glutamate epimerase-like enolase superfamily enzyme
MELKFWRGDLRLTHKWTIFRGSASVCTVLFLELHDYDGLTGLGEAAPSEHYQESIESAEAFFARIDPNRLLTEDIAGTMASRRGASYFFQHRH